MSEIWFISDTHLQHKKVLTFKDTKGELIRPDFEGINHMDEVIINRWNKVVSPEDTVYHLGDVAWKTNSKTRDIINSLNGRKRLCLGNHDDHEFLNPYFERVYLWKYFEEFDFIASHVPLGPLDMQRTSSNVHGHLHEKTVKTIDGKEDLRFLNVCVEKTNYTPLNIETVLELLDQLE